MNRVEPAEFPSSISATLATNSLTLRLRYAAAAHALGETPTADVNRAAKP